MSVPKDSSSLVTIICLCYNQERFILEALQSVIHQTYSNIQLIVVDDASTDNSAQLITDFLQDYPSVPFLRLTQNIGMTRAFNTGLALAQGQYIVDFAGDDILLPDRIEKQVHAFDKLDVSYGVIFSDAWLIDEESRKTGTFYKRDTEGSLLQEVPTGDLYLALLREYCVCAPTIMSRGEVYEELRGYDETLVYEDFDFFIRSSRKYKYWYQNEILTCYRKSANSDSMQWYRKNHNPHLRSTLTVCQKAYRQNITSEENQALGYRVRYHLRQSFFTENFSLVEEYAILLQQTGYIDLVSRIIRLLSKLHLRVGFLFGWYMKTRH